MALSAQHQQNMKEWAELQRKIITAQVEMKQWMERSKTLERDIGIHAASTAAGKPTAVPPRKTHEISLEGKKRISDATRNRHAVARAAHEKAKLEAAAAQTNVTGAEATEGAATPGPTMTPTTTKKRHRPTAPRKPASRRSSANASGKKAVQASK